MAARNIAELLQTPQFGGTGAPSPAAVRTRAAAAGPAMPALRQPGATAPPAAAPAPAAMPPEVAALLQSITRLGAAPATAPAARPPTAPARHRAMERPALSAEAHNLLAKALADPASDGKPLWFSAEDLDDLGLDAATLPAVLAPMGLHALPFGGQGGMLMARSPDLLERAEQLRDQGQPVRIISVHRGAAS